MNLWVDGKEASSIPSPTSFSHPFSRPLHITILEPVTSYLPHCDKGWFVRSVNTMKIGWSSWPYLKICVYCLTRSLLPFLGGPILLSSCFRHNICVRRWMCLSKVAALCYGRRDAQCGQQLLRWSIIYPRRSDPGLKPSRGRAPIHETDGYRRLSAGV